MTYTKTPSAGRAEVAVQSRIVGRFARRAWTMVLALAVSMGFVFVNAGSASALSQGDVIGTNFLRNWATGKCLEGINAPEGQLYTNSCQFGNRNQMWDIVYLFHENYDQVLIRNVGTGLCIRDIAGSVVTTTCTWPGSGSTPYLSWWGGVGSGWDKVALQLYRNTSGGTPCMQAFYGSNAIAPGLAPCNGTGEQLWKLGY